MYGNRDVLNFKGESTDVLDACEQCGNVVGARSLVCVLFVPRFDVSCFTCFSVVAFIFVGMCSYDETCVDYCRCGLILIILFQRHGLCDGPFFVQPFVCGHFSWKDSCKTQNKNIASDAALAARSNVAASASGRISQRMTNKSVEKMYSQSASCKQMCTQMPRVLLVPRVDVVRKCLLICSEQDKANKTTRPPTLNVFVAEGEDSRQSDLRRGSTNQ